MLLYFLNRNFRGDEVAEELTYKRLRDLAREEKTMPSLVKVGPEFYSSVEKFLADNFSKMEESASMLQMREFENATAIIREIALIRQQKMLFRALRGRGAAGAADEMTREEYGIYDRFCGIISEENSRLDALLARFERSNGKQQKQKSEPSRQAEAAADAPQNAQFERKVKKLRFLKDVTAYVGANKETFGPYKSGDEGALPFEEADWLLKQKIAEIVN